MERYKNKRTIEPFVMLSRNMLLECPEWQALSAAAKILYPIIKSKYNGVNNGEIKLYYSELKDMNGLRSPATISKAFRELEQKGWIRRTQQGGLYRHINKYELTGQYDNLIGLRTR
jgi:predicted transcriptional regulator